MSLTDAENDGTLVSGKTKVNSVDREMGSYQGPVSCHRGCSVRVNLDERSARKPVTHKKQIKAQNRKKIDHGAEEFTVFHKIFNDGTTENFILKSALGFLGGILLTYICYLFLIYSLNFTLRRATLICIGLGVILSLGLAFSVRIRCTVLLCIPQLFSKRGRQALLAYAFILALSGPAKNTLHNVEVMSESLACGQEQLKKAENELLKCVHRPNTAVKQSLETMLLKLDIAVKGYKHFIEAFYKECEAVIETIIHAQEWLYSIYVLCDEKIGSPYSRCTDLLFEASQNCKGVDAAAEWTRACGISKVQEHICPTKDEPICSVEDLPPFWPFLNHRKQLNELRREAMNVIYVKVETRQIFTQPNRTATLHEEYQGMATEIRQKTDQFLQYFDVMSVIFGIFILVLFIKVIIYRYKFLTEDEYDNRFITSDFVDIDKTRAEFRMQTLLPLEPRERKKYIKVTSMRLVPYERARLFSSFIFLMFATFKIIIHMLTDCSLYWMLSTMRRHGRMLLVNSDSDVPQITVTVEGTGIYADLLRNVTKTVRPYAVQQILDPIPCLPDPIPPDWNRYCQILTLVFICWLLAFCEPYGLRLRHIVMVTYHPDRARERAIWLYNRILTTRINFVKFARRQLRRKYKDMDEDTFFGRRFFIIQPRLKCLLCKERLKNIEYIKCPTFGCVGIYCRPCFETLQICSICKDPSYYGDYSDVSEEKDSEDENQVQCTRCGCLPPNYTYLKRKPVEDFYTFQMSYNPVPYVRNTLYPKFQISMDTIVDVDEDNPQQCQEKRFDENANAAPVLSPSILTRLMHQCRRAFSAKIRTLEDSTPCERKRCKATYLDRGQGRNISSNVYFFTTTQEVLKEASSPRVTNIKEQLRRSRSQRKKTSPRRKSMAPGKFDGKTEASRKSMKPPKKLFLVGGLKGLGIFKWKLKSKLPVGDASHERTHKTLDEPFKSVYFVDVNPGKKIIHRRSKRSLEKSESIEHPLSLKEKIFVRHVNEWNDCDIRKRTLIQAGRTSDHSVCSRKEMGDKNAQFGSHAKTHKEHCPMHETHRPPHKWKWKVDEEDDCLATRTSSEKILPVIEKWKHPKYKKHDSAEKYSQQGIVEGVNSGSGFSQTSSSEHQQPHMELTDKETQTQPTVPDARCGSIADPTPMAEYLRAKDMQLTRKTSEENLSSSPSSSTYGVIRKELIDSKRKRQKSSERLKGVKFDRRNINTCKGARRLRRCSTRYETTSNSSTELKQNKTRRTRKPRIALTEADIILTNSAQKVLSKKVDMMRAKLAKFFRRSIKKQSSSDEGGTTEFDNEGYGTALSEEEIQELTHKFSERDKEGKKSVRTTHAPDLLSDLPSSKTQGPTCKEVTMDSHADSDLDDDDRLR